MPKLRGIASIVLSQALLVLMLFQSANGGILVLVQDVEPVNEQPIDGNAADSETEISASLLSSPILKRGESSTSELGEQSQEELLGASIERKVPGPDHSYFNLKLVIELTFPVKANVHFGSIAALGP